MQGVSEELIADIVRAVVAELTHRGVAVASSAGTVAPREEDRQGASYTIDFSCYKTPVLTEQHVRAAGKGVKEVRVPAGTVCTMGARELMQTRKITMTVIVPS